MQLLDRFTRLDYDSLEDFLANYDYTVPENFNFAYDVMDEYARLAPGQRAMIWTNDAQEERIFTFGDFGRLSNQAANALQALGLKKGDVVILLLKRAGLDEAGLHPDSGHRAVAKEGHCLPHLRFRSEAGDLRG